MSHSPEYIKANPPLQWRVSKELKTNFEDACRSEGRKPTGVLEQLMHEYIEKTKKEHD